MAGSYVNPHPRDLDHLPPVTDADRPRYRALVRPRYDHDPDDRAHRPRYRHDATCVTGYELLVHRVDAAWRAAAGSRYWDPLDVVVVDEVPLSPAVARAAVVEHVRRRSEPLASRAAPRDVELYVLLDDEVDDSSSAHEGREEPT